MLVGAGFGLLVELVEPVPPPGLGDVFHLPDEVKSVNVAFILASARAGAPAGALFEAPGRSVEMLVHQGFHYIYGRRLRGHERAQKGSKMHQM